MNFFQSQALIGLLWISGAISKEMESDILTLNPADIDEACRYGNVEHLVKLIDDFGVHIVASTRLSLGDNDYSVCLCVAAESGTLEVARLLLKHGADANEPQADGVTPLHLAAAYGKADVARLLLQNGADIFSRRRPDRVVPLHLAAREDEEVLRVMLRKIRDNKVGGLEEEDARGWKPLTFAIDGRKVESVRLLIDAGVNISAIDGAGWTPLHHAVEEDLSGAVELLASTAPEAVDNVGSISQTPLVMAVCANLTTTTTALVRWGASLSKATKSVATNPELKRKWTSGLRRPDVRDAIRTGMSDYRKTLAFDDCYSFPCQHGKCVDKFNKFECFCHQNWTGDFCNQNCPPLRSSLEKDAAHAFTGACLDSYGVDGAILKNCCRIGFAEKENVTDSITCFDGAWRFEDRLECFVETVEETTPTEDPETDAASSAAPWVALVAASVWAAAMAIGRGRI